MKRKPQRRSWCGCLRRLSPGKFPSMSENSTYSPVRMPAARLEPHDLDLLLFYDGGETLNRRIAAELEAEGYSPLTSSERAQAFPGRNQAIPLSARRTNRPGNIPAQSSGPNKFETDTSNRAWFCFGHRKIVTGGRNWRPLAGPSRRTVRRGHFFPLRRTQCVAGGNEGRDRIAGVRATGADRGFLSARSTPRSASWHQHWIDHWSRANSFGKETRKLLPYAFGGWSGIVSDWIGRNTLVD